MHDDNLQSVWSFVDERRQRYTDLSDRIWSYAELAYTEHRSAADVEAVLREEGFRVETKVAGIPTAMVGEWGSGGPVIAILGEYDALPGLSQEAGTATYKPVPENCNGHGCGHNLLGSGALMAAAAVKDWLARTGTPGRVRFYGCPAEEGGAAKTFMVRAGLFKDADVAISWHPAALTGVWDANSLANTRIDFSFKGRASHAAAAPQLGRSALDAVELMSVGVNYMREHMPSDARVHYAYLDAGGIAPNVVQAQAKVRYLIRAGDLSQMNQLAARVRKIAQGAALMTETEVEAKVISAVSNLLGNTPLEQAMHDVMTRLGGNYFDEADFADAQRFRPSVTDNDIDATWRRFGLVPQGGKILGDFVMPLDAKSTMLGSTDVGDVSWVVPTVQARGATCILGTPGHSWQLTAQGKLPMAHKGMINAAKAMAGTAVQVLTDPALLARAKADYAARTAKTPYVCPIPDDVQPALDMSLQAA
ncbi:M20 family metallopeptidase [Ramlibacter albus]|uniref:Amidohydrolase n=1 Tax=Ramlibacter albus TaxID=2079448 RepID=A0A923MBU4_9BURK|nr:M20 family metallopeptidase [Ramlibacter albus]MBC5766454.1 amidohydrolase [Ramlibacter albus]